MKTVLACLELVVIVCFGSLIWGIIDISHQFASRYGVDGLLIFWSALVGVIAAIGVGVLRDAIRAVDQADDPKWPRGGTSSL